MLLKMLLMLVAVFMLLITFLCGVKREKYKINILFISVCFLLLSILSQNRNYVIEQKGYMEPDIKAGFGWVSAKYEVGGYNSWRISSGAGDHGGKSYGIPQYTSAGGGASINAFMKWLEKKDPSFAAPLTKHTRCTKGFDEAWKELGKAKNMEFATYQVTYSYQHYTAPFIKRAKKETGVDLSRSWALLEMAHSTAVQYGSGGTYTVQGIKSSMTDEQIIKKVYKYKRDHVNTNFRSSSASVRRGVYNRFVREEKDVLGLIGKEMDPSFLNMITDGETDTAPIVLKKPKVTDLDLTTSFKGNYKLGYLYSRFAKTLLAIHVDDNKRLDRNENHMIQEIYKKAIDYEWVNMGAKKEGDDSSVPPADSGDWSTWRQGDSKWKSIPLGTGSTIGRAGCLATSIAIQIKRSGTPTPKIKNFNPGTFVQYLNKHGGFSGANFVWNSPFTSGAAPGFKNEFTHHYLKYRGPALIKKVQAELNRGCYMVMRVKYGSGQHWVAITGAGGGVIQMVDPASDVTDVFKKYPIVKNYGHVDYACYKVTK